MTAIRLRALPGTARYELLKVLDGCTSEFSTSAAETRSMKENDRRLVLALEAEALAEAAERVRALGIAEAYDRIEAGWRNEQYVRRAAVLAILEER